MCGRDESVCLPVRITTQGSIRLFAQIVPGQPGQHTRRATGRQVGCQPVHEHVAASYGLPHRELCHAGAASLTGLVRLVQEVSQKEPRSADELFRLCQSHGALKQAVPSKTKLKDQLNFLRQQGIVSTARLSGTPCLPVSSSGTSQLLQYHSCWYMQNLLGPTSLACHHLPAPLSECQWQCHTELFPCLVCARQTGHRARHQA